MECVKYLVANPKGVDNNGNRAVSINMVSCKGYTALHLHCKDALPWATDILYWLLLKGADINLKCGSEKLLPIEHARAQGKDEFVSIIESFEKLQSYRGDPVDPETETFKKKMDSKELELAKKYTFHSAERSDAEPW